MDQAKIKLLKQRIFILVGVIISLVLANAIFLVFVGNDVKIVTLLKKQIQQLENDKILVASAGEIQEKYKDEIDAISEVFPDEESILVCIQMLETYIKESSDEYAFKFNSLVPIVEQDKNFLLMTITMKTNYEKFSKFLGNMERMPYMTHITGISTKVPNQSDGISEIRFGLKIYVSKPFSTK